VSVVDIEVLREERVMDGRGEAIVDMATFSRDRNISTRTIVSPAT